MAANSGVSVTLVNDSAISLIEGQSISLCVGITKEQLSLLDRMIQMSVTSNVVSMQDKGEHNQICETVGRERGNRWREN